MIFVRRDPNLIPPKLLAVAQRAQADLEKLTQVERKEFIERKAHIWRKFSKYLSLMSYGKCWYSESKDAHSFMDVDHFRPKKSAKRSEGESDDGYPWLAFDWDNFRYSSQRANRLSTDEETEETHGKGDWFPLMLNSKTATWTERCVKEERPLLLDPTRIEDVRLIEVKASGLMGASKLCMGGAQRERVTRSIKLLGLDLPGIVEARQVAMRAANAILDDVEKAIATAELLGPAGEVLAENMPVVPKLQQLQNMTRPEYPYAAAVRAQLRERGFAEYCLREEEMGH